jgi:uncharacterized glyoxalase superfamily protein PhnB
MMPNTAAVVRSAWKIIPQFQSRSIEHSVKFYTEELGFELGGTHPDDGSSKPVFGSVFAGRKADANIYLHECKSDDFHASSTMVALGTAELDEFYQLLKARSNVKIIEDVEDKPWGYRQFSIEDCDGNKLTFFKFLQGGNPGGS